MTSRLNDEHDVPTPIDLRDPRDAKAWADAADVTRPWRRELRQRIADVLRAAPSGVRRALELGPGPGLLAETILATCGVERYTMLDFSPVFLEMCRDRVGSNPATQLVLGDFKRPDWPRLVHPPFDAVVAMQAVHELRHKRHVPGLYAQVFELLRPGGVLVVCDHDPPDDTSRMTSLHSTEAEQRAALEAARFERIETNLQLQGMYVVSGRRPGGGG